MPLSSKVKVEDIQSDLVSRFEKTTRRFQNSSECRQILRKIIVDLSEENWKSLYKEIIGKGKIKVACISVYGFPFLWVTVPG